MQTAESKDAILEKAKVEEKAYNWVEAVKLYEQVAESFLGKKSIETTMETYIILGHAYSRAARITEATEEYKGQHENAIKAYTKVMDLFKQVKNKAKYHIELIIK
ncbi:hypothetical protein LCGC14_1378800 [marine sediment metagenome]|uniref:Tetratricopeptide repeat protein n=1 Tax=marine sediment metagenome TaxID=412755 RepID=A0A0F9K3C0_9ZZZZ|nr:hypothetical protein [archaeon]